MRKEHMIPLVDLRWCKGQKDLEGFCHTCGKTVRVPRITVEIAVSADEHYVQHDVHYE